MLKGRSIITVKHKEKIPKYEKLDFAWFESKPLSTNIAIKTIPVNASNKQNKKNDL